MKYQVFNVLPWWFKRHVLRRKGSACPSLYSFDGHVENDDEFKEFIRRESRASGGIVSRRGSLAAFVNKV